LGNLPKITKTSAQNTPPLKSLLISLVILISILQTAQAQSQNSKTAKLGAANINNMVGPLKHDTCLDKKFSIVFYLIQDSAYSLPTNTLAMGSYSIPFIMNLLNNFFKTICVSFEHCKTVIIPNYPYNKWMHTTVGQQVLTTWYTENTINVYIPDEVVPLLPDGPQHAYTFPPDTNDYSKSRNAIVIEKGQNAFKNAVYFQGWPILHQFGHFFGLPHTYSEIDSFIVTNPGPISPVKTREWVERTPANCYAHGDGFCDTDADPYPASATNWSLASGVNCADIGRQDGKGQYYTPPADNLMSEYFCACRFTQEQYNYMARYIVRRRMYLH
jgi:hypothetical protein